MAIAALNAGKHVYCEKPIGITPEQVQKLVKAAKASKKVFTAGQQRRSDPRLVEAIGKIRAGALGTVIMVKAQRHAPADLRHDGSSGDWFFDVTKSGGYLVEQSVHNLDVCNWAIGNHPVRATGFGGIGRYKNDPPGRTILDFGSITYEYPDGVMMSFTQNVLHPKGLPSGGQYTFIYGTTAAADLDTMALFPLDAVAKPGTLAEKKDEPDYVHMVAFYEAITKGTNSPADVTIGAEAALTAIMGHQAMTSRKVVEWSAFGSDL
jgi:predicted dehydrogenase